MTASAATTKPNLFTIPALQHFLSVERDQVQGTFRSANGACSLTIKENDDSQVLSLTVTVNGTTVEDSLPYEIEVSDTGGIFNDREGTYMTYYSNYTVTEKGFSVTSGLFASQDYNGRAEHTPLRESDFSLQTLNGARTVTMSKNFGPTASCTF
jgi:hypothetical protein